MTSANYEKAEWFKYSDQGLADRVARDACDRLRYRHATPRTWYALDGQTWRRDRVGIATKSIVASILRIVAHELLVENGGHANAPPKVHREARGICSNSRISAVMNVLRSDRRIVAPFEDGEIQKMPTTSIEFPTGVVRVRGAESDAPALWLPDDWWKRIASAATPGARQDAARAFASANGCSLSTSAGRIPLEQLGTSPEERAALKAFSGKPSSAWDHAESFTQGGKLSGVVVHLYNDTSFLHLVPPFLVVERLPASWYSPNTTAYLYRARWAS